MAVHQGPPQLDSLPNELKLMVLRHMPTVSSLRHLTRASSHYYRVYTADPKTHEEILTTATLRNLACRNLCFRIPITYISIRLWSGEHWTLGLRQTLQKVYDQLYAGQPIQLRIKQCLSLLTIKDAQQNSITGGDWPSALSTSDWDGDDSANTQYFVLPIHKSRFR